MCALRGRAGCGVRRSEWEAVNTRCGCVNFNELGGGSTSTMQQIIISVHVPKTGGTSFRKILEGFYGTGFQQDCAWVPRPSVMEGPDLQGSDAEIREALHDIRCIHGHFDVKKYMRLMRIDGIKPVFVTWLREPIERAISTYYLGIIPLTQVSVP